jgi:Flp pilus assembly protein TadG
MTLVVVCLLLIALLGIAALCIDLGILYTARTSAQHAADAAALAGAFTFVNNPGASQPTAAQQAAVAVAGGNKILGQTVVITSADVDVNSSTRRVKVTVSRLGAGGVDTFFARAIGIPRVDVQVQATAQASATAGASRCIKPVYIPNTLLSTLPTVAQACTANQVLFDANGNLTTWAAGQLGNCATIRPTNPGDAQKALAPSQFFSLDFGTGANTYRCLWSSCLNDPACGADKNVIACNSQYPVETGNMKGPTKQGVDDLVGPNPDIWIEPGQYQHPDGSYSDTSRAMGTFPVWDNCSNPIDSGKSGQVAKVIGFLDLFVDGMGNANACTGGGGGGGGGSDWVKVHTINAIGCGDGSGGGSGAGGSGSGTPPTGPFATPVQLIKN